MLAVIVLVWIIVIWINAFNLDLITVWIFTVIISLGSIKATDIVFFYDKFSSNVSGYINNIKENKKAYTKLVIGRGVLTIIATLSALYFARVFGVVV